jgi:hypothetical protein
MPLLTLLVTLPIVIMADKAAAQVASDETAIRNIIQLENDTWNKGDAVGVVLDDKGSFHTRLLQVFAKENGQWKVVTYHNVDVKPGTPLPEILRGM